MRSWKRSRANGRNFGKEVQKESSVIKRRMKKNQRETLWENTEEDGEELG